MAQLVEVDTRPLDQFVGQLRGGTAALRQTIRRVVARNMQVANREAVLKASGRLVDLQMGRAIKRRTGRLAASISHQVQEVSDAVFGRLGILNGGEAAVYAGVQEFGATITPKRAKVLAIPLPAALTPAGVPRFSPTEAAEFYDATWWGTSKAGNAILFGRKGDQLVPLFVGKKSVTVKPAYFLTSSMNNAAERIHAELESGVLNDIFAERRQGG